MKIIINKFFNLINLLTNNLFTFNCRPKLAKDYHKKSNIFDFSQLCIIIQGSIGNASFLIETIKIYEEKIFPGSKIVISTWSDESSIALEKIKK